MRKLAFNLNSNASSTDRSIQRANALATSPKSVLEAFEYIVELVEGSNLSEDFFEEAAAHIRYASRKLKLTPMQVVLLSMFVDRSEDSSIRISELSGYAGCRTTKILRLSKEIDVLEDKHYVVASRSRNNLSYRVTSEVLQALKDNKPYIYTRTPVSTTRDFFDLFNSLMDSKDENELSHTKLVTITLEALEEIKDSSFARSLKRFGLDRDATILFIFMAHLFVENRDDAIGFRDIDDLYDDDKIPFWVRNSLRSRTSDLFVNNLIENVNEDGMARADLFKLTDFAKEELLSELELESNAKSSRKLLKHESFAEKSLIYNPKEREQIDELSSILSPDRFVEVQQRLEKAGMRKGFCCLFYGAPGTGKTETVYQLAKRTGRDIMRVDVDKIKSCWVGESEKNIKGLFDTYRNICACSDKAPILLFNEADAVLGVRMEGASRAVDKMENSIQNIILQEMESLEGIMIATTNLTSNLDKAFERRFLYKVRYEKPTIEARAKIWQAMLPALSDDQAAILAREADLSGGEIENIVRKHSVASILSGDEEISIDALCKLCHDESIASSRTRIGF